MHESEYVRLALVLPPGQGKLGEIMVYSNSKINFYNVINLFNEQDRKADIGEIRYQRNLTLMSIYASDERIKALTNVSDKLVKKFREGSGQSSIFAQDLTEIVDGYQNPHKNGADLS